MTKSDASKALYRSPEGSQTWEYLAAFVCSAQAFCVGCVLGWMSPILVILLGPDSPFPVDPGQASTIAAATALGQLIAPLISKPMMDRLGRKNALFIGGFPLVMCWALKYFANNIWMLVIARFLGGWAFGSCICVNPLYLAEIASLKLRGTMASTVSVMLNVGLLFTYTITPFLSITSTSAIFFLISMTVQTVLWFIPESPYFLLMVGRDVEAEEVLEKLRGKLDVSEEIEPMKKFCDKNSAHKMGVIDSLRVLLGVRQNFRAFVITTLFNIPQYFGGFMIIIFYGHVIFAAAGSSVNKNVAGIAVGATKLTASLLTSFLVDRVGRRPLILVAGVIASICNFVIGSYFFSKEYLNVDVSSYNIVPILASVTLVFAFNIGLVSLQSVLTGEVYATDIKATGSCVTGVIAGVFGLIAIKMYLIITDTWHIGHSIPFLGFGVSVALSTIALVSITPETKGKTFAEIQEMLSIK